VLDSNGKGYSLGVGGHVPSAPQPGSTYSWDLTEKSAAIAANWEAITTRNLANWQYSNQASISDILTAIENAFQQAAQAVGAVAGAVRTVLTIVAAV
jgi:hypothetical protein